MAPLPVTSATAGFFGVLTSVLALRVGAKRFKTVTLYGPITKGSKEFNEQFDKDQRAHGNAQEHIPTFLAVLAALEWNKTLPQEWLAAYASAFVLARLAHCIHLANPKLPLGMRVIGFMSQVLLTAGGGAALLWGAAKALRRR